MTQGVVNVMTPCMYCTGSAGLVLRSVRCALTTTEMYSTCTMHVINGEQIPCMARSLFPLKGRSHREQLDYNQERFGSCHGYELRKFEREMG